MHIIRFEDPQGNTHMGCDFKDGSAAVILGDIFGDHSVSKDRVEVKTLLSPILPTAILCIGLNYRLHAKETNSELPKHPVLFMKNPAAVTGPYSQIEIPESCMDPLQVDYEAELAVVIGKTVKNVSVENALDTVLGYACANDVSARRWQKHGGGGQWVRGKSYDTFCPMGPAIVTADEIVDPGDLAIECLVNGTVMQQSSTSDLIFPVAEIISYLSQSTTLLPGTVILTGTPSGVGFARTPPVYLKPGDIVETRLEGLGELRNPVVAEPK